MKHTDGHKSDICTADLSSIVGIILRNKIAPANSVSLFLKDGLELPSYVFDGQILQFLEILIDVENRTLSAQAAALLCEIVRCVKQMAELDLSPRMPCIPPSVKTESAILVAQCDRVLAAFAI